MAGRFAFMNLTPHQRPKRSRNNRFKPLESYYDDEFLREFRMSKAEVRDLCNLLRDDLKCKGHRKRDLTLEQKVLLSLKNFGDWELPEFIKGLLRLISASGE